MGRLRPRLRSAFPPTGPRRWPSAAWSSCWITCRTAMVTWRSWAPFSIPGWLPISISPTWPRPLPEISTGTWPRSSVRVLPPASSGSSSPPWWRSWATTAVSRWRWCRSAFRPTGAPGWFPPPFVTPGATPPAWTSASTSPRMAGKCTMWWQTARAPWCTTVASSARPCTVPWHGMAGAWLRALTIRRPPRAVDTSLPGSPAGASLPDFHEQHPDIGQGHDDRCLGAAAPAAHPFLRRCAGETHQPQRESFGADRRPGRAWSGVEAQCTGPLRCQRLHQWLPGDLPGGYRRHAGGHLGETGRAARPGKAGRNLQPDRQRRGGRMADATRSGQAGRDRAAQRTRHHTPGSQALEPGAAGNEFPEEAGTGATWRHPVAAPASLQCESVAAAFPPRSMRTNEKRRVVRRLSLWCRKRNSAVHDILERLEGGDLYRGGGRLGRNLHGLAGSRVATHARLSRGFLHATDLDAGIGNGEFAGATLLDMAGDEIAEGGEDRSDFLLGQAGVFRDGGDDLVLGLLLGDGSEFLGRRCFLGSGLLGGSLYHWMRSFWGFTVNPQAKLAHYFYFP